MVSNASHKSEYSAKETRNKVRGRRCCRRRSHHCWGRRCCWRGYGRWRSCGSASGGRAAGIVSVPTHGLLAGSGVGAAMASPATESKETMARSDLKLNIIVAVCRYELDVSEFNWKDVIYDIPHSKCES